MHNDQGFQPNLPANLLDADAQKRTYCFWLLEKRLQNSDVQYNGSLHIWVITLDFTTKFKKMISDSVSVITMLFTMKKRLNIPVVIPTQPVDPSKNKI